MEPLESRVVLYSASGNLWPSPQLITISFMPDGTNLGGGVSDLQSRMNTMVGSTWQSVIIKAAQTWASYANINFAVVSDDGSPSGSGSYQQGAPNVGDIRIGGYNFGAGSTSLAQAFVPPPANNFSVAGDITFNTGQIFKNNSTYDLFTVAAHEIGHALGLYHSDLGTAEEFAVYNSVKPALNSDDIAGIRAIYGARSPDAFDSRADNGTQATASDISSAIGPSALSGVVTGLDITTTSDVDYYKFTVPAGASSTITIQVSSTRQSLLSPGVQVYNGAGSLLSQVLTAGSGLLRTLTLSSVAPGQVYYIRVDGTDNTVMGTGAYAIALNLGNGPTPSIPTPNTQRANGMPIQAGGGQAIVTSAQNLVNTATGGVQTASPNQHSVAINSTGASVVVWSSQNQDGGGYGIYAQRYDASGAKLGGEFRVNSSTSGDQINPAVAIDSLGNFLVVWQSNGQDGDGGGIYAQRYFASGMKNGGEFRVNSSTYNEQTNPTVAVNLAGDFVIAWQSNLQDGSGWGIYAQRYSALGIPLLGEFRVNSTTSGDQSNPSVAMDLLGNVVLAWQGQDSTGTNIYAQRYDLLGLKVGGEFRVNTTVSGERRLPAVAMSPTGNWAVVWQSNGQDGDAWGIYGQRYNSLGLKTGGEFRVNTTYFGNQQNPSAAMNSSGDLFVTWTNMYGSTWSINGQQYTAAGAPLGGEIVVSQAAACNMYNPSVALNDRGNAISVWSGGTASDANGVLMQRYSLSSMYDQGYQGAQALRLAYRNLAADLARPYTAANLQEIRLIRQNIAALRAELHVQATQAVKPHQASPPRVVRLHQADPASQTRPWTARRILGRLSGTL